MANGKELEYPWITTLLHQHEESIMITKDMVGDTMNNDLIERVKTLEKRIAELEKRNYEPTN